MTHEIWQGSAELTGYGAVVYETYPIRGARVVDDTTGERVEFEISEPTEVPGPLGSTMYKQDIKLRITADPSRVQELAMDTVLDRVDAISFATDRRVKVSLDLLEKVPGQDSQDEGHTMLFVRRFKGPQDLRAIDLQLLAYISAQIGDTDSDRGRRITRALRWLRRAYLADDEVEEFTILAMGYEALTSLLPRPPAKDEGKKEGKRESSPSSAEILTHWAVSECNIAEEAWRRVGGLRNGLFHGGLTENAKTRSELTLAIPSIRLALGLALKHALNLPSSAPPHLELPPFTITNMQITTPPFIPTEESPPQLSQEDDTGPT